MHLHCCARPAKYKFLTVTHVIFDLDGTLIDSEVVYARALRQSVESYDREYYDDFLIRVQGSVQMDVARVAVETFHLEATPEEFVDIYNRFANEYLSDLDLMPGAERLVRHLHKQGIPIAVATSSSRYQFDLKTGKYSELFSLFHHIVCGGSDPELKKGKPAPDIFLLAASRFDDPPEPCKCLVFEDSTNGLRAGLAAGMQVIMLPETTIPYETWKLATLRLDSFNYMMPELFGLPPFLEDEMSPEFAALRAPDPFRGLKKSTKFGEVKKKRKSKEDEFEIDEEAEEEKRQKRSLYKRIKGKLKDKRNPTDAEISQATSEAMAEEFGDAVKDIDLEAKPKGGISEEKDQQILLYKRLKDKFMGERDRKVLDNEFEELSEAEEEENRKKRLIYQRIKQKLNAIPHPTDAEITQVTSEAIAEELGEGTAKDLMKLEDESEEAMSEEKKKKRILYMKLKEKLTHERERKVLDDEFKEPSEAEEEENRKKRSLYQRIKEKLKGIPHPTDAEVAQATSEAIAEEFGEGTAEDLMKLEDQSEEAMSEEKKKKRSLYMRLKEKLKRERDRKALEDQFEEGTEPDEGEDSEEKKQRISLYKRIKEKLKGKPHPTDAEVAQATSEVMAEEFGEEMDEVELESEPGEGISEEKKQKISLYMKLKEKLKHDRESRRQDEFDEPNEAEETERRKRISLYQRIKDKLKGKPHPTDTEVAQATSEAMAEEFGEEMKDIDLKGESEEGMSEEKKQRRSLYMKLKEKLKHDRESPPSDEFDEPNKAEEEEKRMKRSVYQRIKDKLKGKKEPTEEELAQATAEAMAEEFGEEMEDMDLEGESEEGMSEEKKQKRSLYMKLKDKLKRDHESPPRDEEFDEPTAAEEEEKRQKRSIYERIRKKLKGKKEPTEEELAQATSEAMAEEFGEGMEDMDLEDESEEGLTEEKKHKRTLYKKLRQKLKSDQKEKVADKHAEEKSQPQIKEVTKPDDNEDVEDLAMASKSKGTFFERLKHRRSTTKS